VTPWFIASRSLIALKGAGVALFTAGIGLSAWTFIANPDSVFHRGWARYCGSLETKLYRAFIFRPGYQIAIGQILALFVVAVVATLGWTRWTYCALTAMVVALAPTAYLTRQLRVRVRMIDVEVEGFLVAVANALK